MGRRARSVTGLLAMARRGGVVLAGLLLILGVAAVVTDSGPASDEASVSAIPGVAVVDEATVAVDSSTTTTATAVTAPASVSTTADSTPGEDHTAVAAVVESGALSGLIEQLTLLIGDPASARPAYDRDQFFERADLDGDCIDSRHEVLQEESLSFIMSVNGCKVTGGEWYDPFTDRWFADPGDLQLDHLVALGDAWRSGSWAWSDEDRRLFSNDPTNLNVIHGPENQSKSDDGPAGYSPSNPGHLCAYLLQYGAVKVAWSLSITQADFDSLRLGLSGCDGNPGAVISAPPTTLPPPTTVAAATVAGLPLVPSTASPAVSADCHPAYSPCVPNLAGNAINCTDLTDEQKPTQVLTIGVDPYALDGDNNGVGCESG